MPHGEATAPGHPPASHDAVGAAAGRAAFWRRHGLTALLLLGLALALRLPGLAWLPSPTGDEANWARYAEQAARGRIVVLDPAHRGNSPAFAYLLGGTLRLGGRSFGVLRLPQAVLVAVGCALCYLLLAAGGRRWAGLAAAGLLAVHPVSVLWSRTIAVPYPLALVGMTVAVLWLWRGLSRRAPGQVAGAILLLAATAHLTPLAVVVVPGCLALMGRPASRWSLRHPTVLAAGCLGAAASVPLVFWMLQTPVTANKVLLVELGPKLLAAAHMLLTGLWGEATVRHFTNHALPLLPAGVLALALVLVLVLATGRRQTRAAAAPLAGLGLVLLASGAVLMPLSLAPARRWYLGTIDAERYLFTLLPGLALCLGALAETAATGMRPGARRTAAALVVVAGLIVAGATGRTLEPLVRRSGIFRGPSVLHGGECYHGWLTTADRVAPVEIVRDLVQRTGATTVLYEDVALRPLRWMLRDLPVTVFDYRDVHTWHQRAGVFLTVIWSAQVADPVAIPRAASFEIGRHGLLFSAGFSQAKLERRVVQPDGRPLLEIWSAQHQGVTWQPDPAHR